MRYLRWIGLMSSLLIIGVLGGLMAPLPSEAVTFQVDPTSPDAPASAVFTLTQTITAGCPTGYTCYAIIPTGATAPFPNCSSRPCSWNLAGWTIADQSSANPAKVAVSDVGSSPDQMRFTGVTFIPTGAVQGTFKKANFITTHRFINSNAAGNYYWSTTQTGYFDPPGTAVCTSDRLKLSVSGSYVVSGVTTTFTLPVLDTGVIVDPSAPDGNGENIYLQQASGASFTQSTILAKASCNSGNNKCQPTMRMVYEVTTDNDKVVLENSATGAGGTCDEEKEAGYKGKPPACVDFLPKVNKISKDILDDDLRSVQAVSAKEAQTCLGACIVNVITATPDNISEGTSFNFDATGSGVQDFTLTASQFGNAAKAFSQLTELLPDTDPVVGEWVFDIPAYPIFAGGTRTWQADQISCVNEPNDGTAIWSADSGGPNNSIKGPLRVTTLAPDHILTCTWHILRQNIKP